VGAEGVRVSPNARGVREYLKKEKKGGLRVQNLGLVAIF